MHHAHTTASSVRGKQLSYERKQNYKLRVFKVGAVSCVAHATWTFDT
jgi:hypothetical protein